MFNDLTSLGYGIVVFAIIIGVGAIVISKFATSTASCPTTYPTYNGTLQLCQNASTAPVGTANPSTSTINSNYLLGQIGESGLAGWTPAVIALAVGLLFLGAFMGGKGRKGRY